VYVVADLPNNETAAAMSLAVNQSGVAAVKVVVLMTPEEMDKAGKKAVDYRPAGR
jgi:GYD domain